MADSSTPSYQHGYEARLAAQEISLDDLVAGKVASALAEILVEMVKNKDPRAPRSIDRTTATAIVATAMRVIPGIEENMYAYVEGSQGSATIPAPRLASDELAPEHEGGID